MDRPKIVLIAGPNGAGKTTFAREYLPRIASSPIYLNADLIAAGLSPFAPERAAVQAGRLLLEAIDQHVSRGESFAFETTLSGLGYARKISRWRAAGYGVELIFLRLPTPEFAIGRVAARVKQGGHHIPEEIVRRRFAAGLELFERIYKPLVDCWVLYDNVKVPPLLIDTGGQSMTFGAMEEPADRYPGLPPNAPPEIRVSYEALLRAAERAREIAKQTGTYLVMWRDGRVVHVDPHTGEERS